MHLTSLPGSFGSGDLGPEAYEFIDFLSNAGQKWWQTLPIGPPGAAPAFSPYDSSSAFAGNPWLVSPKLLAQENLLSTRDLVPSPRISLTQVNFAEVRTFREERLKRAFAKFQVGKTAKNPRYRRFCEANSDWLEDFVLFSALREANGGKPWTQWENDVRARRPLALRAARERLTDPIARHMFVQYEFDRQWGKLRTYAEDRGIGLIGDLPLFVAHDSADVWSHQELFQLERNGQARRVSGYPPDRFNENGQCWGHPQYDWQNHEKNGFRWWIRRFQRLYELFDGLRIDHFLGFTRTWSVVSGARDGRDGRWQNSPGTKLFKAVHRALGAHPTIAEDLGHVTPADIQLRDSWGFAAMRIFQFGFGSTPGSVDHLPHNYPRLCAAYTGNHDNQTIEGWFRRLSSTQRHRVESYVGTGAFPFHLAAIRSVMASHANLVIFPMQDLLALDDQARMNTPGTRKGNWRWRLPSVPPIRVARHLNFLTDLFGRGNRGRSVDGAH